MGLVYRSPDRVCRISAASHQEIADADAAEGLDTPWMVNAFLNKALTQEFLVLSGTAPPDDDEEMSE